MLPQFIHFYYHLVFHYVTVLQIIYLVPVEECLGFFANTNCADLHALSRYLRVSLGYILRSGLTFLVSKPG